MALRPSFIAVLNEFNTRFANARKALEADAELRARLHEAQSVRRYRAQIAHERRLGREYVKNEAARIRRELGLD